MQIGLSKVYSIIEKDTLSPRAESKKNGNKYSQTTCAQWSLCCLLPLK